ncbi:50S ribosomal protein L21 [Candidatus Woesebacteria bacterium]|nr:50S ribosomal protein L21 [Candidatus Woesebacteria bacterium]
MTYAIIQLQGKQHRVQVGDQLIVDRLENEDNTKMIVSDVLMTNVDDKVTVGAPFVKGATVELEIIEKTKGEKIRVFKYKSKSRYRKTRGHRQAQTLVTVTALKA